MVRQAIRAGLALTLLASAVFATAPIRLTVAEGPLDAPAPITHSHYSLLAVYDGSGVRGHRALVRFQLMHGGDGTATARPQAERGVTGHGSASRHAIDGEQRRPTGGLESAAKPAGSRSVALTWIHMVTPSIGWALSTTALVRTSDGGKRWKRVLGVPHTPSEPVASAAARSASEAWVVVPEHRSASRSPYAVRVLATTNGGRTWHGSGSLWGSAGTISFVDSRHGWVLTGDGVAAGSAPQSIYRTSDGGRHWTQVEDNHLQNPSPGSLPGCNGFDGLTFRTVREGWATGTCGAELGFTMLYRSDDGGRRWRHQRLPAPPGYRVSYWNLTPPAFFGRYGALPAVIAAPYTVVLYRTRDGGKHWFPTTPIRAKGYGPGSGPDVFALDPQHAWAWIGRTLYRSIDGGQHWHAVVRRLPPAGQLQFVTPRIGYAVPGYDGGPEKRYVLKTVDGGRTWRRVSTLLG